MHLIHHNRLFPSKCRTGTHHVCPLSFPGRFEGIVPTIDFLKYTFCYGETRLGPIYAKKVSKVEPSLSVHEPPLKNKRYLAALNDSKWGCDNILVPSMDILIIILDCLSWQEWQENYWCLLERYMELQYCKYFSFMRLQELFGR